MEAAPRPGDEVFTSPDGNAHLRGQQELRYLDGTVLDCDANMLGQSLIFRNPNAKSECGCGLSFQV